LTVGPEGGSTHVGDMSLYVPRGAVKKTVTLSCQLYTAKNKFPQVDTAKGEYVFSPVLSLHPHGYQFQQPVLVRCPFNAVPEGWLLVLLRANSKLSDQSLSWEEIVVYNTNSGEVNGKDCNYDISHALLSVTHFCDLCWTDKPLVDDIWGQKQLHCSAFEYVYNERLTVEVIVHDRCKDIFEDIKSEQLEKDPRRSYFDGPEVLSVDSRHNVCFEIQSPSWEAEQPLQILEPREFWSSWFGNVSTIRFSVSLRPGIPKRRIRNIDVNVSVPAIATHIMLTVAPSLDEFEPLPRSSGDSGSSDIETPDSTHSVSGSPTEQLSPRAARMDSPDAVDPQVITIVADVGRDRWREIGRQLQFTEYELLEYERIEGLQEKLYRILNDWTRGHTHATTEQLLDVCDEVRIGGLVRREIQARI
jgi:hypothetical protein